MDNIKSDYEIFVQLYNNKITDERKLAQELGKSLGTIRTYKTNAKKEGKIKEEKQPTNYEKFIELYNKGITDEKELAKKLDLAQSTIRTYKSKAKEEGKIKEEKQPTNYEKFIKLYNKGITDKKELAEKLDRFIGTIEKYKSKAKEEGKIKEEKQEKEETKYEQFIELYNKGITDERRLAQELGKSLGTIRNYKTNAKKEGKIKEEKQPTNYEKFIELYNKGITDEKELSKTLKRSLSSIGDYKSKAKEEGKIKEKKQEKQPTNYEQFIELYNKGITDEKELAKKLDLAQSTIRTYKSKAKEEGKIKEEKQPTNYEKFIKLYNKGITDENELSKTLKRSLSSIRDYKSKAKKEGKIKEEKQEKEETKYEQFIELYNKGITDEKELAEKLDRFIGTIGRYKSKAKEEGKIKEERQEKQPTNYEQFIELYNKGITDEKELAEKLDLAQSTIKNYKFNAKKEGEIKEEKQEKQPTNYEKFIELYNKGITDEKELAKKLGLEQSTIRRYIYKAKEEGKIKEEKQEDEKKEETNYEQFIKLYNKGIINEKELGEKLDLAQSTIRGYKSKAKEEGKIKEEKQPTSYKKFIELYNKGTTDKHELAETLKLKVSSVKNYINNAKREGLICEHKKEIYIELIELYNKGITNTKELSDKTGIAVEKIDLYLSILFSKDKISKKEIVILLYNNGERNFKEIAKILGLKDEKTVHKYVSIGKKQSNLEKEDSKEQQLIDLYNLGITNKSELMERLNLEYNKIEMYIMNMNKQNNPIQKRKREITKLLVSITPIEISNTLRVKPYEVYDVIDNMTMTGRKEIIRQLLRKNEYVFQRMNEIKKEKNVTTKEALEQIRGEAQSDNQQLELAEVCYILGARKACQVIAKKVEDNTKDEKTKLMARQMRKKYETEFLARDIRREYKEMLEKGKVSYDALCKKHCKTMDYIEGILGKAERNR